MKTTKNIARLAVTAGLTAALSFGGVMAPVTMAFAAGSSTVTFKDDTYSSTTTYKGIQIFTADVDGTTVKNIQWAGANDAQKEAIQKAVVKAINDWSVANKKRKYTSENAQEAADWLNGNHGVTVKNEQVANNNVLSMIAANLNGSGFDWKTTSAGAPSLGGLDAGYWLFLTGTVDNTATDKSTDTFSSPVYAVIDGQTNTTVTPKKDVPTVDKKILNDAAAKEDLSYTQQSGWSDVADSQIGQEVNYKLTGTIASNYATFDTYAYKFTDELSTGLDYVNGSVEVYALNNNAYTKISSNSYTVKFQDKKLTVDFAVDNNGIKGLKSATADGTGTLSIDANTKIVVFYKAKLNKNAVTGNGDSEGKKGNYNSVKLEYSNNPYTEGIGTSVEGGAGDFTFKLNLNKVDQGTEKGLGNAVFTIQSADKNTNNQYVASKDDTTKNIVAGQLVTVEDNNLPDYVKFTSDAEGKIAASGLDAGSYKVTEVQTPGDSYTAAQPFTFTITPTYNSNGTKIDSLKAEFEQTRSDIAFGELNNTPGDNELTGKDDTGTNPTTGEVTINVGNTKSVGLPLTGLNGVTFTWIAGGAVLCIGVAHLIRSRKQAEESEQE